MISDSLSARIQSLVSQIPDCESLDPRSYNVDGLEPGAVLAPNSYESLANILELANHSRIAVCFEGSGTKVSIGNPPSRLDLIVLTKNLASVLEYVPEDLTISIRAGTKLKDIKKELGKRDQFLPLDPIFPEGATIGGIISANSAGPLRAGYGSVKNSLLGVKVAHADGKISKAGGKVVKNVAGYDLAKLYIGALGTLGCVLEANLKVYPSPESESTLICFSNEHNEMHNYVKGLLGGNTRPVAVELLNRNVLGMMSSYITKSLADHLYCVAVRYFGSPSSVTNQAREAGRITIGQSKTEILLREESAGFWNAFSPKTSAGRSLAFKASVPRRYVFDIIRKVEESLEFYLLNTHAEVSVGLLHFSLQRELQNSEYAMLSKTLSEIRDTCESVRGNLITDCAPRSLKDCFDAWGTIPPGIALMKQIKEKFDPNNILSPGRFVYRP